MQLKLQTAIGLLENPFGRLSPMSWAQTVTYARTRARSYQATLSLGGDPWGEAREAKHQKAKVQTFGGFADEFIAEQAKGFRNAKHIAQWKMTMNVYAKRLRIEGGLGCAGPTAEWCARRPG